MDRKCRVNGDTAGMRVVPLPSLPASVQPNTDPGTARRAYHHGFGRTRIYFSEELGVSIEHL